MPYTDKHEPGSFCWIELGTSDQNAAKTFYSSLFDWAAIDSPMGPGQFYTMFQADGRNTGAAYTQGKPETDMGVPPHWNLYVSVASADESAKRAAELGGHVLAPPFDVMTHGRMAVIKDTSGAAFCIWEPKDHTGMAVTNQPGSFCWADLNTPDRKVAQSFYSGLFGWTFEPGDGDYLHIKNGDSYIGGMPPVHNQNPNAPPHWMIYLQVAECDASTAKAKELGARVYFGPMTIEKVGRMTVIADPQGAVSSLFQVLPRS